MAEPWPNPWASLAQGVARGYKEGQQMSLLRRQQETQERQQKLAGAMNSMKNGMELLAAKSPATRKIGFELIRQVAKNNPELGYNLDNINLDENQLMHDAVTTFAKNSSHNMKLMEDGKMEPPQLDRAFREDYSKAFEELRKADDEDSIKRLDKIMESRRGGAAGLLSSYARQNLPNINPAVSGYKPASEYVEKEYLPELQAGIARFDPVEAGRIADDVRAEQSRLTQKDQKQAAAGGMDFADKELWKTTMRELPKLKKEAVTQATNIQRIDKAFEFIKEGKSGVTGKGGQIKAFIAPYAEMLGVDSRGLNDAQTFQLLTRVIVGPMRLDIIGPGPVSEWEQKLMQQLSGGGGAGKSAALELLNTYKRMAESKVDSYNTTLEGAVSMNKTVGTIYKPIQYRRKETAMPAEPAPAGAGTGNGVVWKRDANGKLVRVTP